MQTSAEHSPCRPGLLDRGQQWDGRPDGRGLILVLDAASGLHEQQQHNAGVLFTSCHGNWGHQQQIDLVLQGVRRSGLRKDLDHRWAETHQRLQPRCSGLEWFGSNVLVKFPGRLRDESGFVDVSESLEWGQNVLSGNEEGLHHIPSRFPSSKPGVNFTNILCSAYYHESVMHSFSLLRFLFCNFSAKEYWQKKLGEKCEWNWLFISLIL